MAMKITIERQKNKGPHHMIHHSTCSDVNVRNKVQEKRILSAKYCSSQRLQQPLSSQTCKICLSRMLSHCSQEPKKKQTKQNTELSDSGEIPVLLLISRQWRCPIYWAAFLFWLQQKHIKTLKWAESLPKTLSCRGTDIFNWLIMCHSYLSVTCQFWICCCLFTVRRQMVSEIRLNIWKEGSRVKIILFQVCCEGIK